MEVRESGYLSNGFLKQDMDSTVSAFYHCDKMFDAMTLAKEHPTCAYLPISLSAASPQALLAQKPQ